MRLRIFVQLVSSMTLNLRDLQNICRDAPPVSSEGTMSVQEALRVVADTHMLAISLPKWAFHLPIAKSVLFSALTGLHISDGLDVTDLERLVLRTKCLPNL